MTDENNKPSGFELDAIDLSSLKQTTPKKDKKAPAVKKSPADTPSEKKPSIPVTTGKPDIKIKSSKGIRNKEIKAKKKKEAKKNILILCFIILTLVILSVLAFLNFKPGLFKPEKTIDNKLVISVKQKADRLNTSIKNLDRNISSKANSEKAIDTSLKNVEISLNNLTDYNNAVSMLVDSSSSSNEPKVFYEARFLYASELHQNYISNLKDCLFAFSVLLKFRIKYHKEIMEGNQLKRLTYERYLLDYKINVKQLNSSHLSLMSILESKKKGDIKLRDIQYYYILPEWINFNRNIKLIK